MHWQHCALHCSTPLLTDSKGSVSSFCLRSVCVSSFCFILVDGGGEEEVEEVLVLMCLHKGLRNFCVLLFLFLIFSRCVCVRQFVERTKFDGCSAHTYPLTH